MSRQVLKEMKSSKFKKKYKAIIFDVDGTLIPNKEDGMPSENVKKAILKASKKIKISIATSRSLPHAIHIIDSLSINSPVILNGGTMIWDPRKKSIIWEKNISNKKYREIYDKEKAKQLSKSLTKIHTHKRAMRKMIKCFLIDYWKYTHKKRG